MIRIPKFLVEMDKAEHPDDLPATPLWVARTRHPFALGLVTVEAAAARISLWPAVLDLNIRQRDRLVDGLVRALFREYDLFPGEFGQPVIDGPAPEPPEFILLVAPDQEREFVLQPHRPILWRIRQEAGVESVEWIREWGVEPEFPRDTRAVAKFLTG